VAYSIGPSSTLGVKYICDRLGGLQLAERHTCGVSQAEHARREAERAFFRPWRDLGSRPMGLTHR
jgi:hypothetical protein